MWILPAWLCYQTIWRGTQIPFLFHSRNHIVLVWPLCVPACASFQCYCLSPADHFFESSLMACDWYNVVVVTVEDFFDYFRGGSPYLLSASNPVTLWSCHSTRLVFIPFLSSRLCSCLRLYFSNFIFSLEKASFYSFTTIMYFLQRHWVFLHWWYYLKYGVLMMFHVLSSLNYIINFCFTTWNWKWTVRGDTSIVILNVCSKLFELHVKCRTVRNFSNYWAK